jgi:hypothetical protein
MGWLYWNKGPKRLLQGALHGVYVLGIIEKKTLKSFLHSVRVSLQIHFKNTSRSIWGFNSSIPHPKSFGFQHTFLVTMLITDTPAHPTSHPPLKEG